MSIRCGIRKKLLFAGVLLFVLLFGMTANAHAGWIKNANGTYSYQKANGKIVKNKWFTGRYYVNSNGVRQTGWLNQNGKWYYFEKKKGKLQKDTWLDLGKYRYYAGSDGAVYLKGVYKVDGQYYGFNSRGMMIHGKRTFNGKTYFFDLTTGIMKKKKWVKQDGFYYYYGSNGVLKKSQWIKNYYYVNDKGYRLTNTWKDDRYLGSSGKALSGLQEVDGKTYYFNPETYRKLTNGSITLAGDTWKFDSQGIGTLVQSTNVPPPGPGVSVQPQYYTDPVVDDETLLSYIIYCEAGNQSQAGKLGVGYVIMNRVYSSLFRASTVREVVYESQQFNPTWDGAMARVYANPSIVDAGSKLAAKTVLKRIPRYTSGLKIYLTRDDGVKNVFPYLFFMREESFRRLGLKSEYEKIGDHMFFTVWK